MQSREIEALVRVEVEVLGQQPVVDGFEGLGAFGDDDDVGARFFHDRLSESTHGEELVFIYHTLVAGEEYRRRRGHKPVLVGVVEQHDVDAVGLFGEFANAPSAIGVDRHGDGGKFMFDLERFVTYFGGRRRHGDQLETARVPFVSTAEDGYSVGGIGEGAYEMFDVRGFPGTAYRDVAHADDGNIETLRRENVPVEEPVAEPYDYPVEPCQGGE